MLVTEEQIQSCFKVNSHNLKGEIVNALTLAETIDISGNPDARAEIGNAILDVFEKYEIPVKDAYYAVEER